MVHRRLCEGFGGRAEGRPPWLVVCSAVGQGVSLLSPVWHAAGPLCNEAWGVREG